MLWGSKSLPYSLITEVTCILNCMCFTSIHIFILYTYIHMCVCVCTLLSLTFYIKGITLTVWTGITLNLYINFRRIFIHSLYS